MDWLLDHDRIEQNHTAYCLEVSTPYAGYPKDWADGNEDEVGYVD